MILTPLRLLKLFKEAPFRTLHPEYSHIYGTLDASKKKCCGKSMQGDTYEVCISEIQKAPDKFKKYLKVDTIEIFCGKPRKLIKV